MDVTLKYEEIQEALEDYFDKHSTLKHKVSAIRVGAPLDLPARIRCTVEEEQDDDAAASA